MQKSIIRFSAIALLGNGAAVSAQGALEEVVVTAQHRQQNNQRIGAAVAVIDAEQLRAADFHSTIDLGTEVPGLVTTTYNSANPQYFIRGIGSTGTSAGEDPSVSVFSDEIYGGRGGTSAMALVDLNRVEVLRGPQGTLFGRNSAGGLIHLISNKPVYANTGFVGADFGSHDEYGIEGAFNTVLTGESADNSVLSRFSFLWRQRDGYVKNLTTGSNSLRESEDSAFRWHLLKNFSTQTRALLTVNHAESDQIGPSPRKAYSDNDPVIIAGFIPLPKPTSDIDSVTLSTNGPTNRESSGVKLKVEHEWRELRFESITALDKNQYDVVEDVSAVGLIVLAQDEDAIQWTQEFRLLSGDDSAAQWSVGFYYLSEKVDRLDITDVSAVSDIVSLSLAGPLPLPDELANYDQEADNTSVAIYGQVEMPLADQIDLVLGGRYTDDSKELMLNATGADPLGFGILPAGPFSGSVSEDFTNFSIHLGLNYSLNDDTLLYGQFSQGYKSGGFDGNSVTLASLNQPFDEEIANTYELGMKAQWLQNRLRTNAALFYTDYEDLQVFQVTNTGLPFIDNAASATVKGLELEVDALFSETFRSRLSFAYLDSTYEEFISAVDDNLDGFPDNLKGNTLTRSPDISWSVALFYNPVIQGRQPLDIFLNYSYQDEVFITPQNRRFDTIDSFNLLNIGLRYRLNESFSFSLHGKNLTDEQYKLHAFDADPLVRNNLQSSIYAEPRTWKASLRFDF